MVVERAHAIVQSIAPRDYVRMARAIRYWMQRAFRFIPDPRGVELVRTPEYMLERYLVKGIITGDCDDAATLGAALGMAVGIPAKFVAIGFRTNGPLAHVFAVLLPRAGGVVPVELDVTKPAQTTAQVRRSVELEL